MNSGLTLWKNFFVPESELPEAVRLFLKDHLRSIEQMEILLLLQQGASRAWTVTEVYNVVRSSERSIGETLETLCRRGLLRKLDSSANPQYQFSPQTDEVKATIQRLADLYSEKRVRIIQAIYSEGVSPADEFAKAFRLRKDENG